MAVLTVGTFSVDIDNEMVGQVQEAIGEAVRTGTYRWLTIADGYVPIDSGQAPEDMPPTVDGEALVWSHVLIGPGIGAVIVEPRDALVPTRESVRVSDA